MFVLSLIFSYLNFIFIRKFVSIFFPVCFFDKFYYFIFIFQVHDHFVVASLPKVRMNNEKLLIKKFIEKYPVKYGRPLENITQGPVTIRLRVQLIQIVKVVSVIENK